MRSGVTSEKTRLQKYSAPALEKGLDILELLSLNASGGLSHAEIAEGVGRSKNEIFRMMVVLEERGYIQRGDRDLFFLQPKFGALGAGRSETTRLLDVAKAYMTRFSRQTNLSSHLWVITDDRMQVALTVRTPEYYSLALSEGTESPLFNTSAGACFLSNLPDQDTRLNALHRLGEYPEASSFPQFDTHIRACARDGFCVLPNHETNDILEISSPLMVQTRPDPVAVLSIPLIDGKGASNRLSETATLLRATIQQISARLEFLSIFQTA